MRKKTSVQLELDRVEKDIAHLAELRSMQELNQGFSVVREQTLGEIQRLMLERRSALMWVLGMVE